MVVVMFSEECTCGNRVEVNVDGDGNDQASHALPLHHGDNPLDASFVHLPPPSHSSRHMNDAPLTKNNDFLHESDLFNQGILNTHRHTNTLLQVAEGNLDLSGSEENEICLCTNCVER